MRNGSAKRLTKACADCPAMAMGARAVTILARVRMRPDSYRHFRAPRQVRFCLWGKAVKILLPPAKPQECGLTGRRPTGLGHWTWIIAQRGLF